MIILFLLILLSIGIAAGFLAGFIWSVRAGQFEDTCTPSLRLLLEEPQCPSPAGAATRTPPGKTASDIVPVATHPDAPAARHSVNPSENQP